jgi:NMD protein affecting ribosome stability and mRNA decay
MKAKSVTPAPGRGDKGRARALVRVGTRTDHRSAAAVRGAPTPDQTLCGGCGAVFVRKTWRRSPGRLDEAADPGASIGVCPACRRARSGIYVGIVRLQGSYVAAHEQELLRRIENVSARAEFTQPERRLLDVVPLKSGLEVRTTSQRLAHRIARELEKTFQGTVTYRWSPDEGSLLATWRRDLQRASRARS